MIKRFREGRVSCRTGNIYLLALLGLTVFYGLEKYAKTNDDTGKIDKEVFWLHISSYALYNLLIGYVLVAEYSGTELYLFTLAMACHFMVNDFGIRHHYPERYHDHGRWILAAAISAGAVLALILEIPHSVLGAVISFIGGSEILNVLKEELPEDRKSNFKAFLSGIAIFAGIIFILEQVS